MSIYILSQEKQIEQNKLLSEAFGIDVIDIVYTPVTVETIPFISSETQSRPGELNGMYGWKWGDNHPKGMLGKTHSKETKDNWSKTRKGSIPWNIGLKSPEHSERMKVKMKGNDYAKGIKYPRCSCLIRKKDISSNTLARHTSKHQ